MEKKKDFFFWSGVSIILLAVVFLLRGFFLSTFVAGYTWIAGYPIVFSPFSKFNLRQAELIHLRFYSNRHDLLLTSPSVRITFDPKLLFIKRNLTASILQIDAHEPTLILHRAKTGHWKNRYRFPDISPFLQANLRVFKGHVQLSDEFWKSEGRPAEINIGPIRGFLDLSNQRLAKMVFVSGGDPTGFIQIAGTLVRPTLAGRIFINAYESSFAGIGDYWIHRGEIHLISGRMDGSATLLSGNHELISAAGRFRIHDGTLVYVPNPKLSVSGLRCDISVNTGIFRISGIGGKAFVGIPGTGKAFGIPFSGEGVIRMSGEPDFYFQSDKILFNFQQLPGGLQGPASLSLSLSGKEPHYLLAAALASPNVSYAGALLGKLDTKFDVIDGRISIDEFALNGRNRRLTLTGNYMERGKEGWMSAALMTGKERYEGDGLLQDGTIFGKFTGDIQNLPLHSVFFGTLREGYLMDKIGFVRWRSPGEVQGEISTPDFPVHFQNETLAASGRFSGSLFFGKQSGSSFWAFGLGKIANPAGSYRAVRLFGKNGPPLFWSVGIAGKKKSFSAVSPSLLSFGSIQNDTIKTLDFSGDASGFDLKAKIMGSATGKIRRPVISTDIYAEGERFNKPVYFSGNLGSDLRKISSKQFRLVWGKSAYDLSGAVALYDGYPLDVKGDVIQGQLADAIRLFPGSPYWLEGITGALSGRFRLAGSIKNPEGLIHFYIHNGSLWDQPIAMAYTDARIKGGIFYLNPFVIRNNEDYFIARGSVGMNGPAALSFDAPSVHLSDLTLLRKNVGVVLGTAQLHGRLSGLISNPSVISTLSVDHLHAKYLHMDRLQADLDFRKGWFDIEKAEIESGDGRILGYIGANLTHPGFLSTKLIFSGVDPQVISNVKDLGNVGLLDGSVTLNGPLPALNGSFDLKLSNERPVSGELAGTVERSMIDFSAMNVDIGNGLFSGSGRLKVGQAGTLHFVGRNLDLSLISSLLHLKKTVTGKVFLSGDLRASLENPQMTAEVHIVNPGVGNFSADDFNGRLLYRNGALTLQDGKVDVPHCVFTLYGLLPVSFGLKTVKSPLLIHVKLDHQDLGMLADFIPGVKAKGLLQADFQISKFQDKLDMAGSAEVSNGKLLPPMLSTPIEDLNGRFSLQNQSLSVELAGRLGNPFTFQGALSLDPALASDFKFSGNNLHLTSPSLFDMNVTSAMDLAEDKGDWTLSGDTTVNPAAFYVAGFNPGIIREFLSELGPTHLNETLTFGDNVQIHHPHLNLYASGSIHAGGTGRAPQLTGDLTGTKGTLEFLGYVFDIRKAAVQFSPDHAQPYLTFVGASTRRIQGSQIFIHLEGYPDDLHLALNSYPPLTQDILSRTLVSQQSATMYNAGNNSVFLQEEAQNWLSTGLPSEVFFPVENAFSSALSLQEFSLQFLPTGQLGLQVGKSISSQLLLTYAQPLTGGTQLIGQQTSGSIWGLEYHLTPRVYLQLNTSNLYGIGGQVLSRFNF